MSLSEKLPSLSLKGQEWFLPVIDERFVLMVSQRLGIGALESRILVGRGFDDLSKIQCFLAPSLKDQLPNPFSFKGMEEGVTRLIKALEEKEPIMVLGDYDVDGATSTAIMIRFFRALGMKIDWYIPDRFKEGYGPKTSAFKQFAESGYKVILTLDCGTAAQEPLMMAKTCGMDVIVIDHHLAPGDVPPACALINPNQPQETPTIKEKYGHLAAVGMSFLFLVGLNQRLREKGWYQSSSTNEPDLRQFLDLVALGTVCDVVPLTGLNRVFVAQGLKIMKRKSNPGLVSLTRVAQLEEKISAYHLGFILGPRINAGGRIGESTLGARLLSTQDEGEALSLAMQGDSLNRERQEIENTLMHQILLDLEKRYESLHDMPEILVVSGEGWHAGVIGIIAGRLKERYHRPVCVIAYEKGIGKASGRSVSQTNLGKIIQGAKDKGLLLEGGGHSMAVGFTLLKEKQGILESYFEDVMKKGGGLQSPRYGVDGIVSLEGITVPFVKALESLEPFGMGNPMPRILIERVRIKTPRLIKNAHIGVRLQAEAGLYLDAIAFRSAQTPLGEALLTSRQERPMDVVGTVGVNVWQGQEKVQMVIEDACFSSQQIMKKEGAFEKKVSLKRA